MEGLASGGAPARDRQAPVPAPTAFQATPRAKRLASKERLSNALKDKSLQIVDARSEGEFCGIEKQKNKHGGAIPGAKHLEWIDLLDKKTERFKTAEQLRTLFREAGIELQRPTATYCQSGGRASVMAFAMELMGANETCATTTQAGPSGATPTIRPKSFTRPRRRSSCGQAVGWHWHLPLHRRTLADASAAQRHLIKGSERLCPVTISSRSPTTTRWLPAASPGRATFTTVGRPRAARRAAADQPAVHTQGDRPGDPVWPRGEKLPQLALTMVFLPAGFTLALMTFKARSRGFPSAAATPLG